MSDDRGLVALTETLRDLDDFDTPWPDPEAHAAAILGDRAVFWPSGTNEYRELIRQYQAEIATLRTWIENRKARAKVSRDRYRAAHPEVHRKEARERMARIRAERRAVLSEGDER